MERVRSAAVGGARDHEFEHCSDFGPRSDHIVRSAWVSVFSLVVPPFHCARWPALVAPPARPRHAPPNLIPGLVIVSPCCLRWLYSHKSNHIYTAYHDIWVDGVVRISVVTAQSTNRLSYTDSIILFTIDLRRVPVV